jgi:3alpha(or 20beta)-hydroxysteroid dehydrogenase
MRLKGKVGLITGAARGIGAASASLFVAEGGRVILADRREDEGRQLCERLNSEFPDSSVFVALDVASEADWQSAVEVGSGAFGAIDVLVNNAGMIRVASIASTDYELFDKVVRTNLYGTFLGIKAVLPVMEKQGRGSIINFSSVQGLEGREGMAAYSASKFGIRGLSKTAAVELGPLGIRVNTVVPGPTRTKMTERPGWTDAEYNAAYGRYPLGRMADANEIAQAVIFLASDESSYCTGADFVIDGGVTAGKPRAQ